MVKIIENGIDLVHDERIAIELSKVQKKQTEEPMRREEVKQKRPAATKSHGILNVELEKRK